MGYVRMGDVRMGEYAYGYMRMGVHVSERCGRKEEKSKDGSYKQQGRATRQSLFKAVTFPKKNELPRVGFEPYTPHSRQSALPAELPRAQILHLIVHLMNRLTINSI